ncbi:MAG: hypothetical protein IJ828_01930 [Treponema sp.]|nr:hypothetical protein [Treponema sp.]
MRKRCFTGLLMAFVSCFCFAQEQGCILYGKNWACMVCAPDGWILDQESFSKYGIYALFYEEGKTLGDSTPIIYVNSTKLDKASDAAMKRFVKSDIESYEKRGAVVKSVPLSGVTDKRIICYSIVTENSSEKSAELCAYTRFKDVCFLIVLTAHTAAGIDGNVSNLESVINNMQYMEAEEE